MIEKFQSGKRWGRYLFHFGLGILRENYFKASETEVNPSLVVVTRSSATSHMPRAEPSRRTLKVLSWNIERGYQWDEVYRNLRQVDFDILMLQESPITSRGIFSQALAKGLNYDSVFYPAIFNHGHWPGDFTCFGQATLSSYPLRHYQIIGLKNVYDWEGATKGRVGSTRNAVYTQIEVGNRTLGIYNIHLDPFTSPRGRLEQLKPALAQIEATPDDWQIVGGDLNLVLGKNEQVIEALKGLGFVYVAKDRHSGLDLDHFLVRGLPAVAAKAEVLDNIHGSDHQPLEIQLSLKAVL